MRRCVNWSYDGVARKCVSLHVAYFSSLPIDTHLTMTQIASTTHNKFGHIGMESIELGFVETEKKTKSKRTDRIIIEPCFSIKTTALFPIHFSFVLVYTSFSLLVAIDLN